MKYWYKCYNYNTMEDYSKFIVQPIFYSEHLDESLDNGEIILEGMKSDTKDAFPPSTKIIIEQYENKDRTQPLKFFHCIVQEDNVENHISMSDIITHRINFIEASAIAQQYHIDNIALTYKLKDVNLEYKRPNSDNSKAETHYKHVNNTFLTQNRDPEYFPFSSNELLVGGWYDQKRMYRNYKYKWVKGNYDSLDKYVSDASGIVQPITITPPRLECWRPVIHDTNINGAHTELYWNTNDNYYCTEELFAICDTQTIIEATDSITGKTTETSFVSRYAQNDKWIEIHLWNGERKLDTQIINQSHSYVSDDIQHSMISSKLIVENESYKFTPKKNTKYVITTYFGTDWDGRISGPIKSSSAYTRKVLNRPWDWWLPSIPDDWWDIYQVTNPGRDYGLPVREQCYAKVSFDVTSENSYAPFLKTPQKYNCLDMFNKMVLSTKCYKKKSGIPALLTPKSFYIYDEGELVETQMNETIYTQKNLWEGLLQIGYYIHAIPYIEFGTDDRFVVKFKKLGDATIKREEENRITVFSSRSLNEYFSSADSYVTNFYNPQNSIDEYIPVKSSSNDYLVYNDVAEIITSKPILEVEKFELCEGSTGEHYNAIEYLYERSIFEILSNDYNTSPSKGSAFYYELGDNKIMNLNFVPPASGEVRPMCFKQVVAKVKELNEADKDLKMNEWYIHIVYKTQDTARVTQHRPDLMNYVQNSKYDQFPIHEQFYGQQDKIIDSERYGNNLYGELIKLGNKYYEIQQYIQNMGEERQCGEIEIIDDETYFISAIENEFYNEGTFQKVEYSKDFNKLSQICTLPSEPRFYEVAERNSICREVRMQNFIGLSLGAPLKNYAYNDNVFLTPIEFVNLVKCLIGDSEAQYANYAIVDFKDDPDTIHQGININEMFPLVKRKSQKDLTFSSGVSVQVAVNLYSFQSSLVYEWDMQDNFSAGEFIDTEINGKVPNSSGEDGVYYSRQPLRYVDMFGRSDLFSFKLVKQINDNIESVRMLPQLTNNESIEISSSKGDIVLIKDNRESISFNYQDNLITRDNRFTFGGYVWERKNNAKFALLNYVPTKFDNASLNLNKDGIIKANISWSTNIDIDFQVKIQPNYSGIDMEIWDSVKAIVFYNTEDGYKYISVNVNECDTNQKKLAWIFYSALAD